MAKAVKAAVTVFAITTGMAFIFQSAGLFALGSFSTAGAFIGGISTTTLAMLSGASVLAQGLMSRGVDAVGENFGSKVSTRSATNPRQIIYGKARVGGTITHIETSGTDNHKLSMIVALAGHEVESLEEVLINDTVLTTTTVNTFQYATNSKFINTDNDNKFDSNGTLLRYKFKDGSQTTADTSVTSNTSLTTTDKFVGVSYIFIEMVFDSEAFGGGIPPMAFVIKGKKVFDPRNNTTAWSDNPALCVRDFITDTTYGLKATTSEVNDTTALGGFKTAANTCDNGNTITTATVNGAVNNTTTVNLNNSATNTLIDVGHAVSGTGISGSPTVIKRTGNQITLSSAQTISNGVTLTFTEKAYTANGITNMSADGGGVIEGLLSSCAGKLSYINGKFVMFAGASVTPDMTITDDNILAPITVQTAKSSGETFNQVKAIYIDANNNYVSTDSPLETTVNPVTTNTYLSEDTPTGEAQANYKKTLEVQLPFTDTSTMAQRLQRTALLHTRQKTALSVVCNIAYMQLQPFDWVYLTNERLGYTNKVFEVLATNLEVLEKSGVQVLATRLDLKEINSNVYAFASSSYTNPVDEGSSVSTGSFSVSPPTSLAVATTLEITGHDLNVSWTNNPDDLVQGTEVFYGTSSGTYIGSFIVGKGTAKESINGVKASTTYYIAVRHFSANNVFSALTSEVTVTTGTAPISYSTGGGNIGTSDTLNILGANLVLNKFKSTGGGEDNENYTFLTSGNGAIGGVTSFQNSDTERYQLFFGEYIGGDWTNKFLTIDADWGLAKGGADGNSTGIAKLVLKGRATDSGIGTPIEQTMATFEVKNGDGVYANPFVTLANTTITGSTTTPIVEVSQGSAPSTTTNKLYNVGGTLYWNGAVVDTGAGDITGVTITTSGQSGLTGGASFTSGNATFTLAIASTINGSKTFSDDVVVQGDLTVEGTTTTIDTTNLDVQDKNITLNYGSGDTSANANGAGITIQDAVSATQDATLTWNTANDSFNFSHNLNFADNVKAQFGDDNDLQIYHDGNNSRVEDTGTGGLRLIGGNFVSLQSTSGENMVVATENGAVTLYHNNASKLTTTSTGVEITGNLDSPQISINDYISHNGDSNTYFGFDSADTFALVTGGTTAISADANATYLRYQGSAKLATTSSGIDVTGTASATNTSSGVTTGLKLSNNTSGANNRVAIDFHTAFTKYGVIEGGYGSSSPEMNFKVGNPPAQILKLNSTGIDVTGTTVTDALKINSSTVIDSSRNLTNIVNLTATGTATLNALTVDTISINAAEIASTGNMTLNSGSDIILDADGGNVMLKDNSVWFGNFNHNGNNLAIDAKIQDGDIVFRGNDGGSTITALTLDISDAGTASFNHDIHMVDNAYFRMGAGGDLIAFSDGTNALINANNGDLTFDVAGNINLDADGSAIRFKDGGASFGEVFKSSSNMIVYSTISNGDMKFMGVDGGNNITALTLDMSDSGKALFNSGANFGNSIDVTGTVTSDGLTVDGTISAYRAGFTQGVQLLGDSGGNQIIGTATNDKKLIIKNLAATKGIEIIAGNKVMDIARGGDISFYEDTGSTAKFFWDASAEKLAIGTTTANAAFTVNHALPTGQPIAEFRSTGNSHATIDLRADGTGDPRIFFDLNGATPFAIGVDNSDGDKFKISGNYQLGTNDRFVIDASGNAMLGKTSVDAGATQGFEFRADLNDLLYLARAGNAITLNRLSSDGDIALFRKDGTTVGSIGARSGALYIESATANFSGLDFESSCILPRKSGSLSNGAVSLGLSSYKFSDLHLSGTANVGTKVITKTTNGEVLRFERASDSLRYNSITSNSLDSGEAFISFKVHDGVSATSQADVLHLKGNGKVGIGEVSPEGKLHIKGGTATGDASHVLFENTQGSKVFAIGGGASGVTNNNLYIRNVTDNTTPMVITDAGATTFAGDLTVTSELNVGQQITASGGITTDQSGQTISGFTTIRVGDALIGQDVATLTTTSASQTNRILASATTYRTLKVIVQIKSSTNFHATEILLTHNGSTVYMTEYATIFSNTSLATFDADISGGNIRLLIDPNQSASTEFKFNVSGIEA